MKKTRNLGGSKAGRLPDVASQRGRFRMTHTDNRLFFVLSLPMQSGNPDRTNLAEYIS